MPPPLPDARDSSVASSLRWTVQIANNNREADKTYGFMAGIPSAVFERQVEPASAHLSANVAFRRERWSACALAMNSGRSPWDASGPVISMRARPRPISQGDD